MLTQNSSTRWRGGGVCLPTEGSGKQKRQYCRISVFTFPLSPLTSLREFAQFEPAHGLFVNERNDILYAARFCDQLIVAQCAAAQCLLNG